MTEYTGLAFSEDENRLLATIRPPSERPVLDQEALRGLLEQTGYGDFSVSDDALASVVERYNTATPALDLPIGERRDASFTLEIAQDSMHAWVNVVPARGGKPLEPDAIHQALGEAGVTYGIDTAAVNAVCAAGTVERCLVASGVPAVNGENARFELLVTDARDRSPQIDEHGLIDFREQGAIPVVAADQPLMRRIPPTSGTAGCNVRGEVIEPVPGKNEKFSEHLLGSYVDPEDASVLRAVFSGQPVCSANGVNVEHVLHVRNVNMAMGNVTFDGTVNIEGEVLPGMKVHATGDIVVGGLVDNAELQAGGDVRVAGGIIAKSQVRAGGTVSARFVENALVHAGVTIAIDDMALQAELQANNQILVGIKSPQRGRLAGGSARAMMLIRTPLLGSPTCGVTRLLLGVNPVLEAKYQELLRKIEKQREEESNLEKLVKHLTKLGDKADMLGRAKKSWQQALQSWGKLMSERDEQERQLALIAGARIEVGVGVEGAIDVALGKKVLLLRDACDAGTISAVGDRVVFSDASGHELPLG